MLHSLKYDDFVLLVVVVEQQNEECVRCCVVVKVNIRVCVFYDAICADFLVLFNRSSESQNNAIILGLPLIITRLSLCKIHIISIQLQFFLLKMGSIKPHALRRRFANRRTDARCILSRIEDLD